MHPPHVAEADSVQFVLLPRLPASLSSSDEVLRQEAVVRLQGKWKACRPIATNHCCTPYKGDRLKPWLYAALTGRASAPGAPEDLDNAFTDADERLTSSMDAIREATKQLGRGESLLTPDMSSSQVEQSGEHAETAQRRCACCNVLHLTEQIRSAPVGSACTAVYVPEPAAISSLL